MIIQHHYYFNLVFHTFCLPGVSTVCPKYQLCILDLSKLIQNGLLYADLALRFPSFIHRAFDKPKAARELVKWCFNFIDQTEVTKGTSAEKTIHLVRNTYCIVSYFAIFFSGFNKAKIFLSFDEEACSPRLID